ncbi:hypothetical protein [Brevundimonas intermedia]|uniref:hypothetical protein n=1 Tax=Brevundimonas intermedia TaxID=74315 RepID=UPI0022F26707|nr:hypothetical protein [Brevundimonas intermedia]
MVDDLLRYVFVDSGLSAVVLDYLGVDHRKIGSESGVGRSDASANVWKNFVGG